MRNYLYKDIPFETKDWNFFIHFHSPRFVLLSKTKLPTTIYKWFSAYGIYFNFLKLYDPILLFLNDRIKKLIFKFPNFKLLFPKMMGFRKLSHFFHEIAFPDFPVLFTFLFRIRSNFHRSIFKKDKCWLLS